MQLRHQINDITNSILTNQNDCMNTLGSGRSKSGSLDTHEGCAEGGTDYVYSTPNHLELSVRATVPELIRYTCGPGRSLYCCTSLGYWDQRGHEPGLTAGRCAPKGVSVH